MKKIFLFMAVAFATICTTSFAQSRLGSTRVMTKAVQVLGWETERVGDMVNVEMILGYDNLKLSNHEALKVTPVIINNGQQAELPYILFIGNGRMKMTSRAQKLDGRAIAVSEAPYKTIVMGGKRHQITRALVEKYDAVILTDNMHVVNYDKAFAYQPWMSGAEIVLKEELYDCSGLAASNMTRLDLLSQPMPPMVGYIIPEPETVKRRQERMTAYVNFVVAKYDIRRDYMNNASELQRIENFTENILNNRDLSIEQLSLVGYASPEGSYSYNTTLAQNRVNSMKNYIQEKYNLNPTQFKTSSVPEDWDSLRNWVSKSNIQYRSEILDIIDTTADPDARDAKIRRLDNSKTYNMLLKDVYPTLRRVDYEISYIVAPFTVEQGKQVMMTNPQHLSLNEWYLIAVSYPQNSPEFYNTFEQSLRYYPNDPIANNNMAAAAIRRGDFTAAQNYLGRITSPNATTLNNQGILNALQGNYEQAETYFRRAIDAGSRDAQYNLQYMRDLELD